MVEEAGVSRPFRESIEAPEGLLESVVLEAVRGPYYGFFVAAYVVATRRGYYAYGKLCREQPASVFEASRAYAKMCVGPRVEPARAMDEIFQAVEARLSRQPFNRTTLQSELI